MRNRVRAVASGQSGEVDPASETIKLATLGLRGVAVNLLWEKANYYKKVEDWTNLTATLEQLAKLQPNFITFWKFQAWNLTYNVSVEFDDYNDRYYYVRRGIEFLKEGEKYNTDNPVLLWDLGWFVGQKIGRADEYVQYRRLFKRDDDFHPSDRPQEQRDNWLVGKEWYLDAIDSVDNKGYSLGRKSPRDFYSSPAKSQMNYAEAIEEEGFFRQARRAWAKAAEEWRQFGNTFIEHSTGVKMRLGTQPQLEKQVADLRAKMEAMRPGTREELVKEKRQALTEEERQILDTPAEKLTPQQSEQLYALQEKIDGHRSRSSPADCPRTTGRRKTGTDSWPMIWIAPHRNYCTRSTTNGTPTTTTGRIGPISSKRTTRWRLASPCSTPGGRSRTRTCRGPSSSTSKASPSGGK